MKTVFFAIILLAFLTVLSGACGQSANNNLNTSAVKVDENRKVPTTPPNSLLDDKTLQSLLAALADERQAQATYKAVLAKFGDLRPFSNIVKAEQRHESILLPLFEKYGVEIPKNEFTKDKVEVPATLTGACQKGIEGEKANIALYDGFLEFIKEADIREAMTYLRDASKNNHLPAFERCEQGGRFGGRRN